MSEFIIVFCTIGNEEEGARLAKTLVEERLAACVNIIGGVRSIYRWQEEICDDPELLLLIKTSGERFPALKERLVELHSYDTPEVIATPIVAGHTPYLDWLTANVTP
jgi:periplasmic divalent cation tolerance protein